MRDTVNIESGGTPCVGLIHAPFETLARAHARQLGMADAPLLVYPQDLPSQDQLSEVAAKARRVAERLPAVLLCEAPSLVVVS